MLLNDLKALENKQNENKVPPFLGEKSLDGF